MEKILRIGQVSHLYGISLDTLRYYDRKNLLKPMVDQQNGYRYYSLEQLDILEMILIGKHLEIPLERIRERVESERIEGYLGMMQEQMRLIESKKEELTKLLQYTTKMSDMLKKIEKHTNDNRFSTVALEKNMEVTIFQVNLQNLFNRKTPAMKNGIEAFEQWVFYEVNKEGAVTENTEVIGLSIPSDLKHGEETGFYPEEAAKQDSLPTYELYGDYRHICFWGKESDFKEYLDLLCAHFKLREMTLPVHFRFALLHKDRKHEYWTDIYFPKGAAS